MLLAEGQVACADDRGLNKSTDATAAAAAASALSLHTRSSTGCLCLCSLPLLTHPTSAACAAMKGAARSSPMSAVETFNCSDSPHTALPTSLAKCPASAPRQGCRMGATGKQGQGHVRLDPTFGPKGSPIGRQWQGRGGGQWRGQEAGHGGASPGTRR